MASSLTFRTTVTSIHIILFIFLSMIAIVLAKNCKKIDNCKCEMDDGSGVISLWDLNNPDGKPRFPDIPDQKSKTAFTFLFNPCTPLKFTSGKETDCKGSNLCQEDHKASKYYPCDASDPTFTVDKSNHVVMTFKSKVFSGHTRYSSITLICDEKVKTGSFGKGVLENPKTKGTSEYAVTLTAKSACPGGSSGASSSLSTGSILLIIFFPLVLLYLIVGIIFNIYVRHKQSVPEVFPNHTFWADFPFLVKDGCVFSFGKMKFCCHTLCEKARGQEEYTKI